MQLGVIVGMFIRMALSTPMPCTDNNKKAKHTHTHTHTHIDDYVYPSGGRFEAISIVEDLRWGDIRLHLNNAIYFTRCRPLPEQ